MKKTKSQKSRVRVPLIQTTKQIKKTNRSKKGDRIDCFSERNSFEIVDKNVAHQMVFWELF